MTVGMRSVRKNCIDEGGKKGRGEYDQNTLYTCINVSKINVKKIF